MLLALAGGGTSRTGRTSPRCAEIEEFVAAVRASWRAEGGNPDVVLDLVPWLLELGFEVISVRPIVDVVVATDPAWECSPSAAGRTRPG